MAFSDAIIEGLKLSLSSDSRRVVIRSGRRSRAEGAEYSFGIEEEYFLADAATLDVAHTTPNQFFEAVNWSTGGQAMREMLQAQLEVVTNIHVDIRDATQELRFLRQEAAKVAAQYGLAIMACGTHPTALWRDSKLSPKPRYQEMIDDLRFVGQRNMLCGMHVHVQLPDQTRRFQVMRAMIPYMPLFIALATSSPFWNSRATGLKGYRLAAYDELPRTGIPELFSDQSEYEAYVRALTCSGVIPDDSYVWWTMRPSSRHPTLELRAPDCCTRIRDAIAIASLYRALVRHLDRIPDCGQNLTAVDRAIAVENKWRAQRYGVDCAFAGRNGAMPVSELVGDLVNLLEKDSDALGSRSEVQLCNAIVAEGTSADEQLRASERAADPLAAAKEWIARTTLEAPDIQRSPAPVRPAVSA
jgi:carboxylate-amine ligase